jgi:hypothetical protein
MFDPVSIGAALTSIRALVEISKNVNDAQLALKISGEIANLQGRLIEVQQQALALQDENQQLRSEIGKLRTSTFHHSVNWRVQPDGSEDGPFCPVCAGEGVEMRLTLGDNLYQGGAVWYFRCPKRHHPAGTILELSYEIRKELVPPDRYSPRQP